MSEIGKSDKERANLIGIIQKLDGLNLNSRIRNVTLLRAYCRLKPIRITARKISFGILLLAVYLSIRFAYDHLQDIPYTKVS